jgi:hypothetical protein
MAAEPKGTYLNQVFKPRECRFVVVFECRGLGFDGGHFYIGVT